MYLSSVDELVGETLGDGLDVPESRLPGSGAEKPDCLARRKLNVYLYELLKSYR